MIPENKTLNDRLNRDSFRSKKQSDRILVKRTPYTLLFIVPAKKINDAYFIPIGSFSFNQNVKHLCRLHYF